MPVRIGDEELRDVAGHERHIGAVAGELGHVAEDPAHLLACATVARQREHALGGLESDDVEAGAGEVG
jgi:hypothetical protein